MVDVYLDAGVHPRNVSNILRPRDKLSLLGNLCTRRVRTNRLGKPYRQYDEAGRIEISQYGFKGNPLIKTRRVIDPSLMIAAYDAADSGNNWVVDTYRVDWTLGTGEALGDKENQLLDDTNYTVITAFEVAAGPPRVYVTAASCAGR